MDLLPFLRDIPDFPKPGIVFKDICPLLAQPEAFAESLRQLAKPFYDKGIDAVVGIESRGFIFAAGLARELACGLVLLRKPGKLPGRLRHRDYSLEYGQDRIEIQADALRAEARVVVVDDVLATGGTLAAAIALVEDCQATVVSAACLIEISALQGRSRLSHPLHCPLVL
ncbi:MAG: adenine phosphoribosyltransferase [Planctomycetota bacterium]|nr:MAG: adenine phosphoribosyltransferase [Planctomycetota bacterium]